MSYSTFPSRPVVIRARRDSIALVLCAVAATFALSNAVHSHRAERSELARQDWTGGLADLAADPIVAMSAENITSASLTVPKSELALPPMRVRPLVRLRGCGGGDCGRAASPVAPQRRMALAGATPDAAPPRPAPVSTARDKPNPPRKANLMSRLNPLNYVPGMTVIKRPFAAAGETVGGWFRRF